MPIVLVHETDTEITDEQRDEIVSNMMAYQDFNGGLVRVARTITLYLLSKSSVLVAINACGIIQIDSFTKFEQSNRCKLAQGLIYLFLQKLSYIIVASALTSVIKLAIHHRVARTIPSPSKIFYI